MLANCAKVHFKRMVSRVLWTVAKDGTKTIRDTSLGCPELERGMLHACTAGSDPTDQTRTPATLTHTNKGLDV